MKLILLLSTLLLSGSLPAENITIEAHKEQLREIVFDKTLPAAIFNGSATITSQTGFIEYPTRLVIGIYENTPKEHAFRVVLEQVEESTDSYKLLYEYINDSKLVLKIELSSEMKLKDKINFSFLWYESNRFKVMINDTIHYPSVTMENKRPFMSIRAGEANINYDYYPFNWKDKVPPE